MGVASLVFAALSITALPIGLSLTIAGAGLAALGSYLIYQGRATGIGRSFNRFFQSATQHAQPTPQEPTADQEQVMMIAYHCA